MTDGTGFPKLSSAQRTGAAGVTITTKIVETELKWRFRCNHQENDFGIDGYVDIVGEDGSVLGRGFAVQIKTGKSHVTKVSDQGFLLYGELKHLNYFLNSTVPVVLVWVDDSTSRAWWVHVRPHAIRMTKNGWSILIPRANRLDSTSRKQLSELAGPTTDYLPLVGRLTAIRDTACEAGRVLFLIAKDEVITGDVSRLQEFFQMFEAAPDVLPNLRNKLILGVDGYDQDEREVYEIPEVRSWYARAEHAVLGWPYYLDLNPQHTTFRVFLYCTCDVEVRGVSADGKKRFVYVSPENKGTFLMRHYE